MKSAEVVASGYADVQKFLENKPGILKTPGGSSYLERSLPNTVTAYAIPGVEEFKKLCFRAGIDYSDELRENAQWWWASDERVDRHGDIVLQNWDFTTFEDNPVMLFAHEWWNRSVGSIIDWKVDTRKDAKYNGRALALLGVFAPDGVDPRADAVRRLVKAKMLRAGSVGFYPGVVLDIKDQAERDAMGLGKSGYVLDQNSLVEWSPCSVPANPGAHLITNAHSLRKTLQPGDVDIVRQLAKADIARTNGDPEQMWTAYDAGLTGLWKILFPETEAPKKQAAVDEIEELRKRIAVLEANVKQPAQSYEENGLAAILNS